VRGDGVHNVTGEDGMAKSEMTVIAVGKAGGLLPHHDHDAETDRAAIASILVAHLRAARFIRRLFAFSSG
jgi:hypothetical protein